MALQRATGYYCDKIIDLEPYQQEAADYFVQKGMDVFVRRHFLWLGMQEVHLKLKKWSQDTKIQAWPFNEDVRRLSATDENCIFPFEAILNINK